VRDASFIVACLVILGGSGAAPLALANIGPVLLAPVHTEMVDGTFRLFAPLRVGPGESLALRNATLFLDYRDATGQPAIEIAGGTLLVDGSRLDTSLPDGFRIRGEAARVTIVDSEVTHYASIMFSYPGTAPAVLANSTFDEASGDLLFTRGATVVATGNTFRDSPSGIAVVDAQASVVGNHFERIVGRAIDIESSVVGGHAFPMDTLVEDNVIEASRWAALLMSGDPITVRGNGVRGNHFGITVTPFIGNETAHITTPTIEGNTFDGNDDGLALSLNGVLVQPMTFALALHHNSFVGNACYDVRVYEHTDVTFLVDATQNWWGDPAGPSAKGPGCPGIWGANVETAPWLEEAP
jgi:hypothetical protein